METKHTPGPWFIEENTNHYPFIMADDNNLVAKMIDNDGSLFYGRTPPETTANAKLIAAAPDLLEALQGIINIGKRNTENPKYDGYFKTAVEAIKKATE